jgi:hypothetical protein
MEDSLYSLVDLGNRLEAQFTSLSLSILDLLLDTFLQSLHLVESLLTSLLVVALLAPQRVHLGLDLTSPVVSTWSLR